MAEDSQNAKATWGFLAFCSLSIAFCLPDCLLADSFFFIFLFTCYFSASMLPIALTIYLNATSQLIVDEEDECDPDTRRGDDDQHKEQKTNRTESALVLSRGILCLLYKSYRV